MFLILFLILLSTNYVLLTTEINENDPYLIETTHGTIRGFPFNITDPKNNLEKTIKIFLGIPFAQPPINELRFEKPLEPKKWKEIKNTQEMPPSCYPHVPKAMMSLPKDHSEDCLYMNIATPEWKSDQLFPVLIFIHGGGYQTGTIREIKTEVMANKYAKNNIVFVTLQYRVGQLGFASTGDEHFGGNYGLWDQLRGLQFVNDNIERFGGDPKRITIWGFSAGAASVSALSLSPLSNNLFQQTIQMSGTFFSEWSVSNRVVFETEKMAKFVGCSDNLDNSNDIKKCLKNKSVDELMEAVVKMGSCRKELNSLLFTPRIDADFFPNDVLNLLQNAPPKRNLIGISDLETLSFILLKPDESMDGILIPFNEIENYNKNKFENFIKEIAPIKAFDNDDKGKEVQNKIIKFYLSDIEMIDGKENTKEASLYFLKKYIQITTDLMFIVPMLQEVHYKFEQNWPIYIYMIDYFNKKYYPKNIPIKGSYHGVELAPLFNITVYPFEIKEYSEEDFKFENVLLNSIINFVHNGNPSSTSFNWPKINDKYKFQYAKLNTKSKIESSIFPEKLIFWQKLTKDYYFDIIKGLNKKTLYSRDEF